MIGVAGVRVLSATVAIAGVVGLLLRPAGVNANEELLDAGALKAESARSLVQSVAQTLLEDIRANRDQFDAQPALLHQRVQEVVFPHFDFPLISRYVLGKAWQETSAEDQQRFVDEFSTLMLHTYGSALLAIKDETVDFLPVSAKPGASMVTVKTEVRNGDEKPFPVDYRLGSQTGEWKVVDVKIDGISLVRTYRSEYGAIVQRQGLEKLITALAERNRRNL